MWQIGTDLAHNLTLWALLFIAAGLYTYWVAVGPNRPYFVLPGLFWECVALGEIIAGGWILFS